MAQFLIAVARRIVRQRSHVAADQAYRVSLKEEYNLLTSGRVRASTHFAPVCRGIRGTEITSLRSRRE